MFNLAFGVMACKAIKLKIALRVGQAIAWKTSYELECVFNESAMGTSVQIYITFKEEADIATIVEMGFEEGFTAALTNLDKLLEK